MTNPACKNCDRQDHCKMYADARAFYADIAEFGCAQFFKRKTKKTNADHMRAMTDEELAEWIEEISPHTEWKYYLQGRAWLDWLKEEYSDEHF